VKEDEDIFENFEDFTEDGKIHLGRNAEKEAARKRKVDMAAQIAAAEGSDPDSEDSADDAEKHRIAAFDAQQTRHGTYAATHNPTRSDPYADMRPKTPPKISPIPTLDGVVARLRKQVQDMQSRRAHKLAEVTALQREKVRLAEEEVRIQRALKETAEKFAQLRREKGIVGGESAAVETPKGLLMEGEQTGVDGQGAAEEEEVPGDGNKGTDGGGDEDDDDAMDEAAATGHVGLGFAGMSTAPGLGLGMSCPPAAEDDW